MKGELAICASPKCEKEFIKTRVTQKCCGNATCRTIYNRYKNGAVSYTHLRAHRDATLSRMPSSA